LQLKLGLPDKCDKCGFVHYRTDPCRAAKPVAIEPETIPKPKRSGNRHRPGYFTEYMRGYRARIKAAK